MKRILTLASWCVIMAVPVGAVAKSYAIKQDGRWSSRIIVSGKKVIFRSSTVSYRKNELVALTFDRYSSKCRTQYITMNFALDKRATRTFTTSNLFGQMRIDSYPIHSINYKMSSTRGSKYGYVYVTNFAKGGSILKEMKSGSTVRFKLASSSGKAYYFNFPLNGFRQSSARARRLCTDYVRRRSRSGGSDQNYFKQSPSSRSNKDYFL